MFFDEGLGKKAKGDVDVEGVALVAEWERRLGVIVAAVRRMWRQGLKERLSMSDRREIPFRGGEAEVGTSCLRKWSVPSRVTFHGSTR